MMLMMTMRMTKLRMTTNDACTWDWFMIVVIVRDEFEHRDLLVHVLHVILPLLMMNTHRTLSWTLFGLVYFFLFLLSFH